MKVVTDPNPILHKKCTPVTKFDQDLVTLTEQMRQTMKDASGMGLAAPQVGLSKSLTVIEFTPAKEATDQAIPFTVLVNPKITWVSPQTITMVEGCLSIPGLEGEVTRPKKIRVKAQDVSGAKVSLKATGLFARIIQHEVDHLNGILYPERMEKGASLRPVDKKEDVIT